MGRGLTVRGMPQWPCAYDDCTVMLNDVDNFITRKYCDSHRKIRQKEQNRTKNLKRPRKWKGKKRNCVVCGAALKNATRYCGKACHRWQANRNRQARKTVGLCHLCYSSNRELKIVAGIPMCVECAEKKE